MTNVKVYVVKGTDGGVMSFMCGKGIKLLSSKALTLDKFTILSLSKALNIKTFKFVNSLSGRCSLRKM